MNPKTLLWPLPLFAGAAAFFITSLTRSAENSFNKDRPTARLERHSPKSSARSGDFQAGIDGIMRESSGIKSRNDTSVEVSLTESDLKERIGFLVQQLQSADPEDWDVVSHLDQQLYAAVYLLGTKGRANLAWIREHHPGHYLIFVAGWAEADPKAVFSHITNSTEPDPCYPATLMTVLQNLGSKEPLGFLTMIKSVPWELFLYSSKDPFNEGQWQLATQEYLMLWLESGAARFVAEEGVEITNLYYFWAQKDLDASLRGWAEWNNPDHNAAAGGLSEILQSHLDDEGKISILNASLDRLNESQLSQMKETWKKIEEKRPWMADRIRESVPLFRSWSSTEEPPP